MRAVIQRVCSATVTVDNQLIAEIGKGLCVLIGIHKDDAEKDIDFIVKKLLNLRIFDNSEGKRWTNSVKDLNLEILCVSQFTLYATLKGNKPDYHLSMGGEKAPEFYKKFLEKLRLEYNFNLIKDGKFGAYMKVSIINDGPVTINLDSRSTNADVAVD